jgi:hypothetical protein
VTHVRKQIRDLAVTYATGLTTTGNRVFPVRAQELGQAELPCWVVTTGQETSTPTNLPGRMDRVMELVFFGYVRAVSNIENTLDAMAAELEAVILPQTFHAIAKDVILDSTEWEVSADELDNMMGVITLTYHVRYHTARGAPDTAI